MSHCAKAIFHCAEDVKTRTLIRQHEGLEPLVRLIKFTENVNMLEGVTGAIWKVAIDKENCDVFKNLKLCESLVPLLHNQPEEVMINVAGSIAECAKIPENIEQIRKAGKNCLSRIQSVRECFFNAMPIRSIFQGMRGSKSTKFQHQNIAICA